MANEDPANGPQADEFLKAVREIRERVRARHPEGSAGEFALPDLMPVLHARDVAEAKVASIGAVNPRPPGALNSIAQAVKKTVARLLNWHVREQVEFNRATVSAIDALLEALSENNRALARWGSVEEREIEFLRGIADLEAGFQHRASMMETKFQNLTKWQHRDFTQALDLAVIDIQKRLWDDLDNSRAEFERLIHAELRLVRQRSALPQVPVAAAAEPVAPQSAFDAMWFAERFRGSQEHVRGRQSFYVSFFQGCRAVLDLGCGRGEFLELVRDAGIEARGIDLSEECIALCSSKGLRAETADLFTHLSGLPDAALDGIFSAQVVEHVAPERIPELIRQAASKLSPGGLLAIETPNPECLAVLTTHFYLDPTHSRPVPAALLKFYMEEFGFGAIQIHRLSPAVDSMPSLAALPEDFREAFFGGLDYAILGRKL